MSHRLFDGNQIFPIQGEGGDPQTLYRSLFVAYPDSLLLVDSAGRIVLANPPAAKLLGYSLEELTGLAVDALVPDGIRPRHASFREAYGHSPRPRPMGTQMDLVARKKDGSEVMVEIALSPLQDLSLPFVVAAIRDISTYPRVRQALQRARYSECLAQFGRLVVDARDPQVLLENTPVLATEALQVESGVVLLLDTSGLEFRVSACADRVPGEGVGTSLPNHPSSLPGYVLSQGGPVAIADYLREKRFEVPESYLEAGLASGLAVPLSDRGRIIGVIGLSSTVANRFGDEEIRFLGSLSNLLATALQRAQSEEALKHAQRLESVGQLTGGIAHDFNNLLTVIQGNLQLLEEAQELADDPSLQLLLGDAARAAKRGAQLTRKLLAFSRRQVLEPTPVDLTVMLGSLTNMLKRTLDQRILIDFEAPRFDATVLADPSQLESALLNIAINGRDAMPAGGTLRFQVTRCTTLPEEVRHELKGQEPDGIVAVSISDTGAGMSEDVKERAFEPFFTTKEAGRGTGLGLSTVYGFVKQSRGAITISSKMGGGTTITLYVPRPSHDAGAPEEAGPPAMQAVPAGLKVLLVEDTVDVRATMRALLQSLQCKVFEAESAEHALLMLGPDAPYDLLLTDIALGRGMRGTDLAAAAQQRLPALPILLMSGFSAELLEADRTSPSDWQLLQKPCSREELARAITQAVSPSHTSSHE
jgi:PAS domain S-box-containing protein